MDSVLNRIRNLKIIPVVTINHPSEAHPLSDALIEGGLPCAEITLRTEAGIDAIRTLSDRKDILVGAGTVLTPSQAGLAKSAGASFIVSPGINPKVVQHCLNLKIPIIPGTSNPTDIETALELGVTTLKFFPAEAFGGIRTIKAISAPYPMIEFIPTGGISLANMGEYLSFHKVIACGGSWMVKSDWIKAGNYKKVTEATKEAVESIKRLESAVHE